MDKLILRILCLRKIRVGRKLPLVILKNTLLAEGFTIFQVCDGIEVFAEKNIIAVEGEYRTVTRDLS